MIRFTNPLPVHENVAGLPDERIDACFRTTGRIHKDAARALMGLVGEVERRGLAARAHLGLHEYARVHGGLSRNQVELALRLDRRTRDLPHLRKLFQHGVVALHRLRVVLGIATPALDRELADLVTRLTKPALEAWVRNQRGDVPPPPAPPPTGPQPAASQPAASPVPAPLPPASSPGSVPVAASSGTTPEPLPGPGQESVPASSARVTIAIGAVLYERLRHEQAHLADQRGRSVSLDELLHHLLDGGHPAPTKFVPVFTQSRDGQTVSLATAAGDVPLAASDLAGMEPACLPIDLDVERDRLKAALVARPPAGRARPAAVDRYVHARSRGMCEFPRCGLPGHGTHHWIPFAEGGTHDPDNLSRLCKAHMDLADRGLVERSGSSIRVVPPRAHGPARPAQRRYETARRHAIERKIRTAAARAIGEPAGAA